jgi:hypothetical protein
MRTRDLKVVLLEEGENLRHRLRKECLFDRGEVERAESGQVDAVVGLVKGCGSRDAAGWSCLNRM